MPRTREYTFYSRWHPRFVEAYSHLEALYEDKPRLKPSHEASLTRIREDMLSQGRLRESDRRKLRDILRQLGRKMPRTFVGRVFRGEKFYSEREPEFKAAKRDLQQLWDEFCHLSTPPAIKPEHASRLRDIHDKMAFKRKIYESQRQTLYKILDELGRKPSA